MPRRPRARSSGLLLLTSISILGCQGGPPQPGTSSVATITQSVATEDSLGNAGSVFFPFGFYADGHTMDVPCDHASLQGLTACKSATDWPTQMTHNKFFVGAAPTDPADAVKYYDETFSQMRSLGVNAFLMPNVDFIDNPGDGHLQALLAAAARAGGLYGFPSPRSLEQLSTEPLDISQNGARCGNVIQQARQAELDGAPAEDPARGGVLAALAASAASCVNGSNAGQYCSDYLCQRNQTFCCPGGTCTPRPGASALAGYYPRDEPAESCLPALRLIDKYQGLYDPTHYALSNMSTTFTDACSSDNTQPNPCIQHSPPYAIHSTYRSVYQDKVMANDQAAFDDQYPLWSNPVRTAIGDVFALEYWASRIDDHYMLMPEDKPMYYVLLAAEDGFTRMPTPAEIRYLTYTAIGRGVKGIFYYLYGPYIRNIPYTGGITDTDYNLNPTGQEIRRLSGEIRTLAPWLAEASRDLPQKNRRGLIANALRGGVADPYDTDVMSFTTRSGEKLVMVVNERMAPGDPPDLPLHVVVDQGAMQPFFAKGPVTVRDLRSNSVVAVSSGPTLAFDIDLPQGDGMLLQLQSALSADIRIPRGSYHNPVTAPTSIQVNATLKNTGTGTWSKASHHIGVQVRGPDGGARPAITGLNLTDDVPPGGIIAAKISIPTGPGTSFSQTGTYELSIDLYQDGPSPQWFGNAQTISVMVVPNPLLVDTFDSVPYNPPPDVLWSWDRTAFMKIRADRLAINGQNGAASHWGSTWSNYTFEFDVMIDLESQSGSSEAGWMVRAPDGRNGYVFVLQSGKRDPATGTRNAITPFKMVNGTLTPLGAPLPTGLTIQNGHWYHVKHVVSGSTIHTFFRDTQAGPGGQPPPLVTLSDVVDQNAPFLTGGVGFYLREPPLTEQCNGGSINRCCGGDFPGMPCVADSNCLGSGASCGDPSGTRCPSSNGTDSCYPTLDRGHYDNVVVYTTDTAPPSPAQVIGLANQAPNGAASNPVQLSWSRAQDSGTGGASVSHYRVYRASTPSVAVSPANLVAEPAATAFVDTTLAQTMTDLTVYYVVTAVNSANVEGPASTALTVAVSRQLAAPAIRSATPNHMKSVTLDWDTVPGAARYLVYRGPQGFTASPETLVATVTAPPYEDTSTNTYVSDTQLGLNGLTAYQYIVAAQSQTGMMGPPSGRMAVTTPGSNVFSDGFDGTDSNWHVDSGIWSVVDSSYVQSNLIGVAGSTITPPSGALKMGDLSAEFVVQLQGSAAGTAYAGMTIRKTAASDRFGTGTQSGYLIYYQPDGKLGIRVSGDDGMGGNVIELVSPVQTGLSPLAAPRRVRVDASGFHIRVFVDNTMFIDALDAQQRYADGYLDLTTFSIHASFQSVNVFFREGFTNLDLTSVLDPKNNWVALSGASTYDPRWIFQLMMPAPRSVAYRTAPRDLQVADFVADYAVRIDQGNSDSDAQEHWAAFSFHKTSPTHTEFDSGYMVYYRPNGKLQLYGAQMGPLGPPAFVASPLQAYQHLRVWVQGNRIRVFVNGSTTPAIDYTDVTSRWGRGYVHLVASETTSRFEFLEIY